MLSNASWSKIVLSLALTGSFVVVTACGSPSLPAADAAAKTAPAKDAAPAKTADAKPAPKAADAKPAPKVADAKAADKAGADKAKPKPAADEAKGDQLVANFNFKDWDKEVPHRWIAAPADKAIKTAGTGKDSVYVELKPSGTDKPTTLRQHLSGNIAGKSVTVTLRVKASEAKMLSAKLSYETKAGPQTLVLDAEGHGAWESVTKTVSIPADAKPGSGALALVLRPGAKKSALVDYVTAKAK